MSALCFAPMQVSAAANLNGAVYSDASNQRIVHATVTLCDAGGNRLQDAITNDSGTFAFLGIPAGGYILKVQAPGYNPTEIEVNVDFGTAHGVSVFLSPVRQKNQKADASAAISVHELAMPESARRSMDAGKKKLYADKSPDRALLDFQAAVAKAPDYYEAYYQIGMTYLALQKPAEAEQNLAKSVELSQQKFADADLALAMLWLSHHDSTRGEPLLLHGLELNPNSWTGYYELGKLELYRNHLGPALNAAEKAKELAPEQAMIYRLLSLIHLRQKNDTATIADLDAYIRLDPDSPEGQTAKKIRADIQSRLDKAQTTPNPVTGPQ